MSKPSYAQIEFAKTYLKQDSTFTAASAIQRLEMLLDDIRTVGPLVASALQRRLSPSFFEFTSYYKVGFVTCLEWHAKSRLYDIFCFDPKKITAEDIKQAVSNDKLVSMLSEGLTIPHMIAGSSSVSSKDSYVSSVSRLFAAIGANKEEVSKILDATENDITVGELLANLYSRRNDLVHEIGLQEIGHRNIRDFDTFDDALQLGERLLRMIKAIEKVITDTAPEEFPNRLDNDGWPVDQVNTLTTIIKSLEVKIESNIALETAEVATMEDWKRVTEASRNALSEELAFIDGLNIAGSQYFDPKPFIKTSLLKQRIQYLTSLSSELVDDDIKD